MKADVLSFSSKKTGAIELDDAIFGLEPRKDILHRCVVYQLAKRQQGTHHAQERNEVRGTSKKSGPQKGSGGARHGNRKANIFRGGGKAHGPRPRSHAISLPKKVRRLALMHALSSKYADGSLIIIDEAKLKEAKTKAVVDAFAKLNLSNALIVDTEIDENLGLAARNIAGIDLIPVMGANVYDILRKEKLVLTKAAVEGLEARLK
ncbi:MAG: 50S ribosomal protein L4 [Alphaproteobacteria bacterium]|nr:50S ribosomal protein L4 [Alphaproteobacteria bacterium]